ncbi:hypothetical protein CK203_106084 [Vitis vinifera]|uniref:Uncharacterized protein n=1 Tax=Vitis vinifera TaxID=29760 RepID=A0A438D7A8_VITVI|nr:hypothetical protein CK203_106084 [Vitis vinifera]
MDRTEQRIRQLRVFDSSSAWDDLDSILVANLPAKFRILDIESPPLVCIFGVFATQDMG